MLDAQVKEVCKKNIEKQISSFENDFHEARRRFKEIETYTNKRIRELRASVGTFRNPNDISKWSDIIDGLEELQNIVDMVRAVDCPASCDGQDAL